MSVGFTWNEKVVVITGASEGIGASCAKLIEDRGAKLSLTALPSGGFRTEEAPSRIVTAGDITEAETRRAIVDRTLQHFGRIDVLINNAGVGQYGFPTDVDLEISKHMFDINVFSALALIQLVIPHMRARKSGLIVNLGSVGGKVSLPWSVMYCATKWATHCVNDALRRELDGTGIRVMKVCPGIVDTKFREHVLAGNAPAQVQSIGRVVSPETVARAIMRGVERSKRSVFVPRIGVVFTSLDFFSSRMMDWYLHTKFSRDAARE